MTIQRALLLLIAVLLATALLPAGLLLERRLEHAIELQVRRDLAAAPGLLVESRAQAADAMMMHAKEIASTPGLARALMDRNDAGAVGLVESARAGYGEEAVLLDAAGRSLTGPSPPVSLVERASGGEMPVEVVADGEVLRTVALSPVMLDSVLAGVAGVTTTLGTTEARAIAGLTRAEVVIVSTDGRIAASTAPAGDTAWIAGQARSWTEGDTAIHGIGPRGRLLVVAAPLGAHATAALVRDLDRDRAILGTLRRIAVVTVGAVALFALVLGVFFAMWLSRPVRSLATAADRLASGDFHAPIERPRIAELGRMADAFDAMRTALAARIGELAAANRELADRQERLSALQAELIQRDRLATAGQLVAQLAHEIRNPVANVRNCLELLRRRLRDDAEAREFADLAIDELLRMHEMAEQVLDMHRPQAGDALAADAGAIARDVAVLAGMGAPDTLEIAVDAADAARARIAPDALKQVLLSLAQNAREAMRDRGRLEIRVRADAASSILIDVTDSGPGIPSNVLARIFDPFFTTKGGVHGVGLGLFVAEGIIRGAGGRIVAANRGETGGARFTITLSAAPVAALEPHA